MKTIQHTTRWLGRTLARGIQYLNPCQCRRSTLRHALAAIAVAWLVVPSAALAQNRPPIADGGPNKNIYLGESVMLEGSAVDPDGDPIFGWEWEVVSAPTGCNYTLAGADTPNAHFTTDMIGDYVIPSSPRTACCGAIRMTGTLVTSRPARDPPQRTSMRSRESTRWF